MGAHGFLASWLSLHLESPYENWSCWARAAMLLRAKGRKGSNRPNRAGLGGLAAMQAKQSCCGWRELYSHTEQKP